MVRHCGPADFEVIFDFWNRYAPLWGYAEMTEEAFCGLLARKWENCFALEDGALRGFACGSAGYLSCLVLADPGDRAGAAALLDAMENAGARRIDFFDPIHLPWVLPGTDGHQHNNCPGVDADGPLYPILLARGWQETHREQAMYLDLRDYTPGPEDLPWYDPARHYGLEQTVYAQANPDWNREMPRAAREQNMLVALEGNRVIGCAGPVYPEKTGRGYFAGILIHPDFQGKGHGKRLFAALCKAEKEAGAEYMSLFTGTDNPAANLYKAQGFRTVKEFALMKRL